MKTCFVPACESTSGQRKFAPLRCVRPQFQWYQLAYATEIKSTQLNDTIDGLSQKIYRITLRNPKYAPNDTECTDEVRTLYTQCAQQHRTQCTLTDTTQLAHDTAHVYSLCRVSSDHRTQGRAGSNYITPAVIYIPG